MQIALTFLFFLMIQVACAQDCFLVVSSGGGIAGTATVYKISPDGKVLKGRGLGKINYDEQSKLKKSTFKTYYLKAKAIVGTSPDFNHPGNMYYSLGTLEKGKESKITWGDNEHAAPEQAVSLYEEITKIVAALPFTANTTK